MPSIFKGRVDVSSYRAYLQIALKKVAVSSKLRLSID
jgi:hypothetical protein